MCFRLSFWNPSRTFVRKLSTINLEIKSAHHYAINGQYLKNYSINYDNYASIINQFVTTSIDFAVYQIFSLVPRILGQFIHQKNLLPF